MAGSFGCRAGSRGVTGSEWSIACAATFIFMARPIPSRWAIRVDRMAVGSPSTQIRPLSGGHHQPAVHHLLEAHIQHQDGAVKNGHNEKKPNQQFSGDSVSGVHILVLCDANRRSPGINPADRLIQAELALDTPEVRPKATIIAGTNQRAVKVHRAQRIKKAAWLDVKIGGSRRTMGCTRGCFLKTRSTKRRALARSHPAGCSKSR